MFMASKNWVISRTGSGDTADGTVTEHALLCTKVPQGHPPLLFI